MESSDPESQPPRSHDVARAVRGFRAPGTHGRGSSPVRMRLRPPPPLGLAGQRKRSRQLWRDEGLRVPQRRRKKRLTGMGVAVGAMPPIRPDVIWAIDSQFVTTADGRTRKMLNVIDEFTREALAIEVIAT